MDYVIREMRKEEYCLLENFYIPDGMEAPPKSIIGMFRITRIYH